MKEFVLGFAFYNDHPENERANRVLLLKKDKPEQHKGLLNGFGGAIEEKESVIDAMVREFKEKDEAGITTTTRQWKLFAILEKADARIFCLKTSLPPDRLDKAHADNPMIQYVNARMLPHNVVPDLHYLIPVALASGLSTVTFTDQQA